MNEISYKNWLGITVSLFIMCLFFMAVAVRFTADEIFRDAANVGVGKWVENQRDGSKRFYWVVGTNLVERK